MGHDKGRNGAHTAAEVTITVAALSTDAGGSLEGDGLVGGDHTSAGAGIGVGLRVESSDGVVDGVSMSGRLYLDGVGGGDAVMNPRHGGSRRYRGRVLDVKLGWTFQALEVMYFFVVGEKPHVGCEIAFYHVYWIVWFVP